MLQTLLLSLRNLFRQKRRNILLGTGIAFGVMVLIVAISFTHGITDMLLNEFMKYASGHIRVATYEGGNRNNMVIRDKERIKKIINETVNGVDVIMEDVSAFVRAVGNGKSDIMVVVGVEPDDEFLEYYGSKIIKGSMADFTNGKMENPIFIMESKAKKLNVTIGDKIAIRTQTIYGQQQTANLSIAAIMEADNEMMSMAVYIEINELKKVLGYRKHETGSFKIIMKHLNNPKKAISEANKLHEVLKPNPIGFYGKLSSSGKTAKATFLAINTNENDMSLVKDNIKILSGDFSHLTNRKDNYVAISEDLAQSLSLKVGSSFKASYETEYGSSNISKTYIVGAIFDGGEYIPKSVALLGEIRMYDIYYADMPKYITDIEEAFVPKKGERLYPFYASEWELLERTQTSEEMRKKMQDMGRKKYRESVMDVSTMYENFEAIITLDFTLTMMALIGVLILFFIILIGVFNTLRMTIRERTREVGTMRAIGMQRHDVRRLFVFETVLLAFIASIVGVIASFIVMGILGSITLEGEGMLAMLLYEGHLRFVPKVGVIILYIVAIVLITAITAFFPAKRASELSAAEALRHYE